MNAPIRLPLLALGVLLTTPFIASSQVVINEIMASASTRLQRYQDDHSSHVGNSLPWQERLFDDVEWIPSSGGLHWDTTPGLEDAMEGQHPSVYLRQTFTVNASDAASEALLQLVVAFEHGFVVSLNGREVARRNLGPSKVFVPFDHLAFNEELLGLREYAIGEARDWLVEGENVLAVQAHTFDLRESPSFAASLTKDNSVLADASDPWRYFVGRTEPSGGVFDLATPDVDGGINHEDWIELRNLGSTPVDLSGWGLSDDHEVPWKWTFPDGTSIDAQGYLVVLADGKDVLGNKHHTNFRLSASGEYLGLSDTTSVVDAWNPFPRQEPFYSFGRVDDGVLRYFERGTPGEANTGSDLETILDKPDVDIDPGFYDNPVVVALSSDDPEALIRYTKDGSEPTMANGEDYESPLTLMESTVLRARAFQAGHVPSNTRTASYLIYESTSVLRSLPAVSLSGDGWRTLYDEWGIASEDVSGSPEGNYRLRLLRGRSTERQAEVEFLSPTDPSLTVGSGVGMRFASSDSTRSSVDMSAVEMSPWEYAWQRRPSMNLFFRDEYGKTSINDNPALTETRITEHTSYRLRAGKSDTSIYTKDEIIRRTFRDMGHASAIGSYVNLWFNGEFKGIMNLTERYRLEFFQETFDHDLLWDVVSHGHKADEGDLVAWNAVVDLYENHDLSDPVHYAALAQLIDMEAFVDCILLMSYTANTDWINNWFFARPRQEGAKFFPLVWDAESSMREARTPAATHNYYRSENMFLIVPNESNPVGEMFTELIDNPEFKLKMADRIAEHFFHDGALMASKWVARQDALRGLVGPLYQLLKGSVYDDSELYDWFSQRRSGLFATSELEGFWSETDPSIMPLPPEFHQHGGTIGNGFQLMISNANAGAVSEVFYTVDESDPRDGGTLYTAPIDLDGFSGIVAARARVDGKWGPLQDATFISPVPPPLRITEIMYHPANPDAEEMAAGFLDDNDFEFIELRNVGTGSLNLAPFALIDGITFDFADATATVLASGEHVLLVKNQAAFEARYGLGLPVVGVYEGSLKNSGERLVLSGPGGLTVHDFEFRDDWYPTTDGDGFSLEIIDDVGEVATWAMMASWQPSGVVGGTPGEGGEIIALPDPGTLVINEVLTHTDMAEGDWVEIYNTSDAPIDIGGWFLSDDPGTPLKYQLPASTIIGPHGYLVLNARDHFGVNSTDPGVLIPFGLSESGDEAVLTSGVDGAQTGYQEVVDFEGAAREVTFGRHVLSTGEVVFTALVTPTPGAANALPLIPPILISKIHYHPLEGSSEFVELLNVSDHAVPLFDPGNPSETWRFTNGIEYTFPEGVVLGPGCRLLVVPFDPAGVELAGLVGTYAVPPGVGVFGPYTGQLANDGERLTLSRPGAPDPEPPHEVPLIVEDSVRYNDKVPWPLSPDGEGDALKRVLPAGLGDDPASWEVAPGGLIWGGPPSSYDLWLQAHVPLLALADLSKKDQWLEWKDVDQDQFPNIVEFYMGMDPLEAEDDGLAIDRVDDEKVMITYRRAKDVEGYVLEILVSEDLTAWEATEFTTEMLSDEGDYEVWRAEVDLGVGDSDTRFFQLEVSVP